LGGEQVIKERGKLGKKGRSAKPLNLPYFRKPQGERKSIAREVRARRLPKKKERTPGEGEHRCRRRQEGRLINKKGEERERGDESGKEGKSIRKEGLTVGEISSSYGGHRKRIEGSAGRRRKKE